MSLAQRGFKRRNHKPDRVLKRADFIKNKEIAMKKFGAVTICHLCLMALAVLFNAFTAVMFIGGFGTAVAGIYRVQLYLRGFLNVISLFALVVGILYILYGYGKNAAIYYKAFLFIQIVGTVLLIAVDAASTKLGASLLLALVAFSYKTIVLLVLTFGKDLGENKTWALYFVFLALDAAGMIAMLFVTEKSVLGYALAGLISTLLLDATIGFAVKGKYDDKKARGAK